MKTLKKDKAGNKIVKYDDGRLGVKNAKGGLVNAKDSASYLRDNGYFTETKGKKLFVKSRGRSF